jgi:hypothetical protein
VTQSTSSLVGPPIRTPLSRLPTSAATDGRTSQLFPGRTDEGVKSRWFKHIKPQLEPSSDASNIKPHWPAEDDTMVTTARERGDKWEDIAMLLPGRSEEAARSRWRQHIKPRLEPSSSDTKSSWHRWSADEDATFKAALERGDGNADIAKLFPGRCDEAVRHRRKGRAQPQSTQMVPDPTAAVDGGRKCDSGACLALIWRHGQHGHQLGAYRDAAAGQERGGPAAAAVPTVRVILHCCFSCFCFFCCWHVEQAQPTAGRPRCCW